MDVPVVTDPNSGLLPDTNHVPLHVTCQKLRDLCQVQEQCLEGSIVVALNRVPLKKGVDLVDKTCIFIGRTCHDNWEKRWELA